MSADASVAFAADQQNRRGKPDRLNIAIDDKVAGIIVAAPEALKRQEYDVLIRSVAIEIDVMPFVRFAIIRRLCVAALHALHLRKVRRANIGRGRVDARRHNAARYERLSERG